MQTIHLKITGRVQGVYFRASSQLEATSLKLTGWVKNTGDYVEAVVSGEEGSIEKFVGWARRGPESAIVKDVEIMNLPYRSFKEFSIKRTNSSGS